MIDKSEITEQANLAFDFIQKLYLEVSYLIKEIEGILYEENEKFIIGRPSGYGISARSSTGLEANNVKLWLLRKFAVFFVPEENTKLERGQTITQIDENLKVLYFRILLNDKSITKPTVYAGVLYNIEKKPQAKWPNKVEQIVSNIIEYNDDKIFQNIKKISYENAYIRLQGELIENKLFEINDSETILERIIKPSLELYRKY